MRILLLVRELLSRYIFKRYSYKCGLISARAVVKLIPRAIDMKSANLPILTPS